MNFAPNSSFIKSVKTNGFDAQTFWRYQILFFFDILPIIFPPLINFARQLDCKGKNLLNDSLDAKRLSSVFLLRDGKNIQGLSNETLG